MSMLPNTVKGVIVILLSTACFVTNDAVMKSLSDVLTWYQAIGLRSAFATVLCVLLALAIDGRRRFSEVLGFLGNRACAWRIALEIVSATLFVFVVMHMPLADATAINQLLPILLTLGGGVVLKEQVGWRRVGAAIVGFAGVLLIVQPGTGAFTPVALVALVGTTTMAARDLVTRRLPPGIPSTYVIAFTLFCMAVLGALVSVGTPLPALDAWVMIRLWLAAGLITLAFLFLIVGTRLAEVSFLAPFRFSALVWGLLLGVLVFHEAPGPMKLAGAALIVGAGLYTFHRERAIAKRG